METPNHRFKVGKSNSGSCQRHYDTVPEKLAFRNLDFLGGSSDGAGMLEAGTRAGGKFVKIRLKRAENISDCTSWLGTSLSRKSAFAVFRKAERCFYEVTKPRSSYLQALRLLLSSICTCPFLFCASLDFTTALSS